MKREIDIDSISDGKRYRSSDMVKVSCNDCDGCSECCRSMGTSIVLDPYDVFMLASGLNTSFDGLISGERPVVELSMADGILLPNIKMQEKSDACIFLNENGKCSVHAIRPGFCRMFPLGRIYENGQFSYFNQIYECTYPNKSKIKIKKWLGIEHLGAYENFVLKWHDYLDNYREKAANASDINEVSQLNVGLLENFYRRKYRDAEDFYRQMD